MQNPESYYAVPKCEGRIWEDWQQSGPSANYSWSPSSSRTTLGEGPSPSRRRKPLKELNQRSAIPISYNLTPPTPSATDSDASSSSQISMESIPEYDEMPEIPFVSAAIAYPGRWTNPYHPPEDTRVVEGSRSSFWSGIIGMRPSTSKSSANSHSPVLGQVNERIFAPSRVRKRSGSVSSIASSRTRPAPAKSILSSSSSVKTRRRKAPSVKFLDSPTIHYEEDQYDDDNEREPSSCMSPPPPKKARGLSGFFTFKWLFGPSSFSKAPAKATAPDRPTISGPFPLWNTPPRRTCSGNRGVPGSSAASLRSMRSTGSLRSIRSCSSRLPTPAYWPR
ncbi:hypothetical protein OH76DRAFT_608962 [Lentinus brumalis]|uniref:Uncharacterized protein n=1 Tax=Lentinus brumalis TaxID=2498619 RepID=A0A371DUS7_9APHY|nr:hypothetical protein OH76DRAFT_608962 [Polyporus brumalis]